MAAVKARARNTDPTTSHLAAASVRKSTTEKVRTVILHLLADYGPMTDTEIEWRYGSLAGGPGASPSGLRTRRAELVSRGLVVDMGTVERTPSGRAAIVWGLAPVAHGNAA